MKMNAWASTSSRRRRPSRSILAVASVGQSGGAFGLSEPANHEASLREGGQSPTRRVIGGHAQGEPVRADLVALINAIVSQAIREVADAERHTKQVEAA